MPEAHGPASGAPGWRSISRTAGRPTGASPGETGVPPEFDWGASRGVGAVSVEWPLPVRFMDSGLESIGYKHDVILPMQVFGVAEGDAPKLVLDLSYAVCREICVPEFATLELQLDAATTPRERLAVESALARVPAAAQDVVNAATVDADAAALVITLAAGVEARTIFVEGEPGWYLPAPQRLDADGSGSRYTVSLSGVPKGETVAGRTLTVTVDTRERAVQQRVRVSGP